MCALSFAPPRPPSAPVRLSFGARARPTGASGKRQAAGPARGRPFAMLSLGGATRSFGRLLHCPWRGRLRDAPCTVRPHGKASHVPRKTTSRRQGRSPRSPHAPMHAPMPRRRRAVLSGSRGHPGAIHGGGLGDPRHVFAKGERILCGSRTRLRSRPPSSPRGTPHPGPETPCARTRDEVVPLRRRRRLFPNTRSSSHEDEVVQP